jgi:hypothetical protein
MELIWDGERDLGSQVTTLARILESGRPPAGVFVSLEDSLATIEISTRSAWAFATWAVSAIMVWFGLISDNWLLLVLAPFMAAGALMQSFGKVSILVNDSEVRVFEGVAGIGRRVQMTLRSIQRIEYAVKRGRGGSTTWIVLNDGARDIKFGRHLNEEQIRFVIASLLDAMRSDTL